MEKRELVWKHATSKSRKELIQKEGFDLSSCDGGMWGEGVYFTDSFEDAMKYGPHVLEANIPNECVVEFQYENLVALIPDLLIEEEAGDPTLKEIVTQELGKEAVAITYSDGITHLVVYDPICISLIH